LNAVAFASLAAFDDLLASSSLGRVKRRDTTDVATSREPSLSQRLSSRLDLRALMACVDAAGPEVGVVGGPMSSGQDRKAGSVVPAPTESKTAHPAGERRGRFSPNRA